MGMALMKAAIVLGEEGRYGMELERKLEREESKKRR